MIHESRGSHSLTSAWGSGEEQSFSGHLLVLDHIDDDSCGLSGLLLTAKTSLHVDSGACLIETEAFDMGVGSDSLGTSSRPYFFDFHDDFSL